MHRFPAWYPGFLQDICRRHLLIQKAVFKILAKNTLWCPLFSWKPSGEDPVGAPDLAHSHPRCQYDSEPGMGSTPNVLVGDAGTNEVPGQTDYLQIIWMVPSSYLFVLLQFICGKNTKKRKQQ